MTDSELRDAAVKAAMAAMAGGASQAYDPFVFQEEQRGSEANVGHHGMQTADGDRCWTFSCSEDPETHKRTGGWSNGRLQLGYDCEWGTPDVTSDTSHTIADCDTCDDGYHSIEIDLNQMTAKVIVNQGSLKPSEYERGIVNIYIGYVQEGKLLYGIHMNPVCYHIL